MSEEQLVLATAEPELKLELVDGAIADEPADVAVIAAPAGSGQRNLFGEAERIAVRAASASTRRECASIWPSGSNGPGTYAELLGAPEFVGSSRGSRLFPATGDRIHEGPPLPTSASRGKEPVRPRGTHSLR